MFKIAFIILSGIGIYFLVTGNSINQTKTPPEFISRVSLQTNCELELNSFGLKNLRTGQVTNFTYGETFIRARRDDELQIVMAPEFSNVSLQGKKFLADPKINAFQDCNERVSLESIFTSMNEQFGHNK